MNFMKSYISIVDKAIDKIGLYSAYSSILLTCIVVYEVIARRVFASPTIWAQESTTFAYGFLLMMVMGYGMVKGSHVSVDLITANLSERTRRILDLITFLVLFFPFITLMIPVSVEFAINSWVSNEKSWSQWAPPVYPIKTVIPVALILLWLSGLSRFFKSILWLAENKKDKALVSK